MIGTQILHYRIEARLGEGGMGAVYLAENTHLHQRVALKFLPPHFSDDPELKARLEREAVAAAALSHPNIVTVHDLHEHEGQPFIAMEYLEGSTLSAWCAEQDPSLDDILDVTIQIGEGLKKAHEAGIVHRDLKPSNIIVDRDGRPKILDFGLAKLKGVTKVTATGSTLGTASYMSPEQSQGQKVDHRTDIWSWGVILYEMLARRLPFEAEHEAAIAYAIAHETPHPLARYSADVPDELQRIISKCLAKTPDERYQHADELVADLKHRRRALESAVSAESSTAPRARRKRRSDLIVAASVVAFAVVALLVFKPWQIVLEPTHDAEADYKMIAVLPFENLGSAEDEYFADGITDEITSRLARVSALRVISRTSAMQYKNTDKSLPQIGEELGVDYILEGTILWDKSGDTDRVRITPQLIKVDDDFHIWADKIERPLTKLFAVQADIAKHITEALNVTLMEPERRAVEARPTENLDAYNTYLRARELLNQPEPSKEHTELVVQLLQNAVTLDPDFALAYAALSRAHSEVYHYGYGRSDERLRMTQYAAQRAIELEPQLPEAHLAMGWYHYDRNRDYDAALAEFTLAERSQPNHSRVMLALGTIHKRQGRFEEALDYYRAGRQLDPRSVYFALEIGVVNRWLRRYSEAERYYSLVTSLAPDEYTGYVFRAGLYRGPLGNLQEAREVLESIPPSLASGVAVQSSWLSLEIHERDYAAALRRLESGVFDDTRMGQDYYQPLILSKATLYDYMGEREQGLGAFESARVLLERRIEESPDDYRMHASLGRAYAGLGRKDAAIEHGRRAVELFPVSKDAIHGPSFVENLAGIYVMVGDYEAALDELEYLLSIPSTLSVESLRLHPEWAPLREHPRFQALLEKGHKVF